MLFWLHFQKQISTESKIRWRCMTWLYLSIQFQNWKLVLVIGIYTGTIHSILHKYEWKTPTTHMYPSCLLALIATEKGNNSVNKYLLVNLHQSGAMIVMNKRGVNFWHRLANVVERRWSLWWVCLVIKNTVYERFRLNRMLEKYLLGTQTEVDQSWKPLDKWGHKLLPVVTASGE